MGYYTDFSLDWDANPETTAAIEAAIEELEIPLDDEAKWYDYGVEMTVLTRRFPDVLFTLTGIGQEHDDIWRHYFKGAHDQKEIASITFAPSTL